MLTVSSIILAIAFLTFVWISSRVQSAVAIHMRPDAVKAVALNQAMDDPAVVKVRWQDFERALSGRWTSKGAYQKELVVLLDGGAKSFRSWVKEETGKPDVSKRIDLKNLPTDESDITMLTGRARAIGLNPVLENWADPALRLAGIKSAVQAEVNRFANLQLSLQRQGMDLEADASDLARMSPTTVWLIIISLMVCGVGITNAMLMSVTERFREIGTMKCLGALDSFIIKLFLLESTFQGTAGTLFGVLIGFTIMMLSGLASYGGALLAYFPTGQVLLIVLWGVLIGSALSIVAAVFPALRAAQMAPVEAMRVEE
jgi:hypothetical protein